MANNEIILVPTGAAAGDVGYFNGMRWVTGKRMPKGHMEGLRLRWKDADEIYVETGSCRNAADDGDLVLSAEATVALSSTASFATPAHGRDFRLLTGTIAVTAGSPNVTGTSTLFKSEFGTRDCTGTVATTIAGATVTGTGTKFLTEFAVGDLIHVTTSGGTFRAARRITAIASDTSLTTATPWLANDSGATIKCIEQPRLYVVDTGEGARVETISADTTLVTVANITVTDASSTAHAGAHVISTWYFPWLVSDGTDTIVILSTQRTTPFLSGVTSKRRIPCAVFSNSSGNIAKFHDPLGGSLRLIGWDDRARVLSGGSATSATTLEVITAGAAPPTASHVFASAYMFGVTRASGTGDVYLIVGALESTTIEGHLTISYATTTQGGYGQNTGPVPLRGGSILYIMSANAGNAGFIDVPAFVEAA